MKKKKKLKKHMNTATKSGKLIDKGEKNNSKYYFGNLSITSVSSLGVFASSSV